MDVRNKKGYERANEVVGPERYEIAWVVPSASLMKMPCHAAQRMACISQLHLKAWAVLCTADDLERICKQKGGHGAPSDNTGYTATSFGVPS